MKQEIKYLRRRIEGEIADCLKGSGIKSVLVAVSGGADSVALLMACWHNSKRLGLRVEAVNCNFHLRGKESGRDSEFTSNLCKTLGVKLHSIEYDVEDYIKKNPGLSTEMACRELRYADFYRIMEEDGLERVAVAHNADDDIETMMLNMLRGSGCRGLKGMAVDNGKVIRPLLSVSRKEIEEYLEDLGVDFIIDSSNLTNEYQRNFIRHEILPLFENRWTGARKSLSKTVRIMKEESEIIENFYNKQLEKLCPDDHTLLAYSAGVTTGTILRFIEPYGGNSEIADEIKKALDRDFCARRWNLDERYTAVLERDRLIITDIQEEAEPTFLWDEMKMSIETFTEIKRNRNHNIVYLPHDHNEYIIRKPKIGDRVEPLGMRGTRLVSDIISDAKLDSRAKAQIRVLARKRDGQIIWVTGLKRSRHDLLNEDAEICYKVEYRIN